MKLTLKREIKGETFTAGTIYDENGTPICCIIEDKDRGLTSSDSLDHIREVKVPNETAIPTGTYRIDMDTVSPRFGSKAFYKQICLGKLPRLEKVPGYTGVLIHVGNDNTDSSGCLLTCTEYSESGWGSNSKQGFINLYKVLEKAHKKGEEIWLTIE